MADQKSEIKEVVQELVGWDNKIWLTLRDLTLRPGSAIKEYVFSDKQKYVSPFAYYFFLTGIFYYLFEMSGVNDAILTSSHILLGKSDTGQGFNGESMSQFVANRNVASDFFFSEIGQKTVLLPLTLLLRWLVFKKFIPSFKANTQFTLFVDGHVILTTGVITLILWMLAKNLAISYLFTFLIAIGYDIWASLRFYDLTIKTAILRNLLYVAANIILISISSTVIGLIIMSLS